MLLDSKMNCLSIKLGYKWLSNRSRHVQDAPSLILQLQVPFQYHREFNALLYRPVDKCLTNEWEQKTNLCICPQTMNITTLLTKTETHQWHYLESFITKHLIKTGKKNNFQIFVFYYFLYCREFTKWNKSLKIFMTFFNQMYLSAWFKLEFALLYFFFFY